MSDVQPRVETADESLTVLFEVGHPAHVHLFRNAIAELEASGHRTFVASREKELTTTLLDAYDIDHRPISTKGDGVVDLAVEWVGRELRLLQMARSLDPDVMVGILSPASAHVAKLLGVPSVLFHDTEVTRVQELLAGSVADTVCTPSGFDHDLGDNHRRYDGYQELAYLHPDRFEPDPEVLRDHGVDPDSSYTVLRFVSWGAHHDVGHTGISNEDKRRLVERLLEHGDVYITSEAALPEWFEEYRLPVPPEDIFHLLAYATLYVGDSGTMATEAALLGTPAIKANSFAGDDDMSNFRELEGDYDLLRSVATGEDAITVATELLADPASKARWAERRAALLDEKIDVTEYMIERILEAARLARVPA